MTLRTIRLELARTADHPEGSADYGYEFKAPLDADGHFDTTAWRAHKGDCTVHRFGRGTDDQFGRLVHRGSRWLFDYDEADTGDDEPIFRFDRHVFREGEYITITEPDEQQRTFRVTSVR